MIPGRVPHGAGRGMETIANIGINVTRLRTRDIVIAVALLGAVIVGFFLIDAGSTDERELAVEAVRLHAKRTGHGDDTLYATLAFDPRSVPIRMFWRDEQNRLFGNLLCLKSCLEGRGERLRLAMNGGMYHKDRTPVGLFIENGRVVQPLDTSSGLGNFYLKPNGVFAVRKDGSAFVTPTECFVDSGDIAYATQSGPMLLVDGVRHPVFEEASLHLNIRNGVGTRPDGTVVFAISRDKVNLYSFAEFFRRMGCNNALYLDGFVSRCYCPEMRCEQLDGDFGVMIGVLDTVRGS